MLDMKIVYSTYGRSPFHHSEIPGMAHAILLGLILTLAQAVSTNARAQDTATQIATAPVFYQNLKIVGSAPSEEENATLLIVIGQMKIHGPEPSLPALESFMTNYPTSSWVPSLRAN